MSTTSTPRKKRSKIATRKAKATPINGGKTTIEWGLFRRNGNPSGYVQSLENDCLLSGREFENDNPVTALEGAFSSIAQVISELNLERGTEVRVSVRRKS